MVRVSVISPERTLFEGEAEGVVAPAFDGEVGILTGHAPMMTLLGRGVLRLSGPGGARFPPGRGGRFPGGSVPRGRVCAGSRPVTHLQVALDRRAKLYEQFHS